MNIYSDYRSKIKSGDLLAFSNTGWKSWSDIKANLVRMFTQSEYSHVGLAWVVGERVFVVEQVIPYARIYPLSMRGSFYHTPLSAPWQASTEELALSYVGKAYRQLQAIRAFFQPLGKGNVSQCAAMTLSILSNDGIYLGDRATPDEIVRQAQLLGYPTYYVVNKGLT